MLYRLALIGTLFAGFMIGQQTVGQQTVGPETAATAVPQLLPDMNDPGVVRAQQDMDRVRLLIGQGAVPMIRMRKAQEDLEIAKDMSILKQNIYSTDLLPEQADQMVLVAQRIVLRRQRALIEMQQLVSSGVISRAEAENTGADFERSQAELRLAEARAHLIQQMAETLRIEKGIASLELQVDQHPDWNGSVYTRYDGKGAVSPSEIQKVSMAFLSRFGRSLPVSADGATALHRSMGFDHRGRVDVAVSPDQAEGVWLKQYLEQNQIPYFAFRMAVPGKATGAHIHIGPASSRITASY